MIFVSLVCTALTAAEQHPLPVAPPPRLVGAPAPTPAGPAVERRRLAEEAVRREIASLKSMEEMFRKVAELEGRHRTSVLELNAERAKDGLPLLLVPLDREPEWRERADDLRREWQRLHAKLYPKG